MLETIIGLGLLVAIAIIVKNVLAGNKGTPTQSIIGGGTPEPDSAPRHDDGSVSPPKSGPDAE